MVSVESLPLKELTREELRKNERFYSFQVKFFECVVVVEFRV